MSTECTKLYDPSKITAKDEEIIAQAEQISRWRYRDIDPLIARAESYEARKYLINLRWDLYDSMLESL